MEYWKLPKILKCINQAQGLNKGKRLYFDEITVALIKDFQRYLLDELGNKLNTVHANLKVIRRLLAEAISDELIPYEKNQFLKIKLRTEKSHRLFLLDDELDKLKNLKLTRNSRIECHRDMYVFSANTGGIRISDLLLMRWRNFDGTHLCFQIKKTQDDIRVRLPDESVVLLDIYHRFAARRHPRGKVDKNAFIFPLLRLAPEELDGEKIHNAISAATAYTNKDLGKLSRLAGLDKHITFHTARLSWAIRALQKGMCIEYVSKLLGHALIKQTEVYAKVMNQEYKAMDVFNKQKIE